MKENTNHPNVRESGFQNPGIFVGGIWNPGLWNPEYSSRSPESHQRLESRIQVPLTKTGIRNPQRGIQNPRLSWISLYEVIQ